MPKYWSKYKLGENLLENDMFACIILSLGIMQHVFTKLYSLESKLSAFQYQHYVNHFFKLSYSLPHFRKQKALIYLRPEAVVKSSLFHDLEILCDTVSILWIFLDLPF